MFRYFFKFLFLVFLFALFYIQPTLADRALPGFDNQAPQTYVTLPWVSPATGQEWIPSPGSNNADVNGPNGWEISHGTYDGSYFSCHFGSDHCAESGHHLGEDWAVGSSSSSSANQSIYAINNGIVVYKGEQVGLGYVIVIRHDVSPLVSSNNYIYIPAFTGSNADPNCETDTTVSQQSYIFSYYLHLGTVEDNVEIGSHVFKGQQIGSLFEERYTYYRDDTNEAVTASYGAHLHLELWYGLRYNSSGQIKDGSGYDPTSAFTSAPLIHPQCFYKLNNRGLYITQLETDQNNGYMIASGQSENLLQTTDATWILETGLAGPFSPEVNTQNETLILNFFGESSNFNPVSYMQIFWSDYAEIVLQLEDGTEMIYPYYFPFVDNPPEAFFTEHATNLWIQGIIEGYQFNNFAPHNNITRAEYIKMVVLAANIDMPVPSEQKQEACSQLSENFSDIESDSAAWYCPFLLAAYDHTNSASLQTSTDDKRIVNGSAGNLNPNEPINRAEAVKILANAFELVVPASVSSDPFPDVAADQWYAPYVQICKDEEAVDGYENGNFGPGNYLTRGQAAKIINIVMTEN